MIQQFSLQEWVDTMEHKPSHKPVMLDEVLRYLQPQDGGIFVDGTLGLGGHSLEILKCIGPTGHLVGIDRDVDALKLAKENLIEYKDQCDFVHENYKQIDQVLGDVGIDQVDGILLDLGISSFQLDNPERGFSLRHDGPLDMRMDKEDYICAFDLVNSLSEKEISQILKDYGQERWHHRIAHYLILERAKKPIETTQELSNIILRATPYDMRRRHNRIHPATRSFQAFRIAVNRELEGVDDAIDKCVSHLKPGGRLVMISFHSGEDRIVKHKFKSLAKAKIIDVLTKKPLRPTETEVVENARARSARLRSIERKVS